jgi:3-demethoxyubiquinol 3-hydroxylase
MSREIRAQSPLDRFFSLINEGLKTTLADPASRRRAGRPNPAAGTPSPELPPESARHAAGLMRVNHAGEIAAQGLYHGQALFARSPAVRRQLEAAALEEGDHLAWCEERLGELGAGASRLNPLWYAGSVAMGATMALAGDAVSLGFIAETERQVEAHLDRHLADLPEDDLVSRTIVAAMRADEARHGEEALAAGGRALPAPLAVMMRAVSRVMTTTAYRL